jgi:hypothetical protein
MHHATGNVVVVQGSGRREGAAWLRCSPGAQSSRCQPFNHGRCRGGGFGHGVVVVWCGVVWCGRLRIEIFHFTSMHVPVPVLYLSVPAPAYNLDDAEPRVGPKISTCNVPASA